MTIPSGLSQALTGRYTIDRELGQGGMATVFLAQDVRHDRPVAIKVLRPDLAAVIGAERFLREIKTIANLQHPHILGLIDSGEVDGTAYYVMPYIEGESLRDRLVREKQLPVGEAVRIATEVAGALDYAHRHGVIHRDIKPENILLHDGQALVADFGIALAVSTAGNTRMTETGMSLGTPHYMSPEQAMGDRDIGPQSDVYALGCVTYEMLVGEPPFNGPTAQAIIARVMTEEPRSLTLQRRTIPPQVEGAVMGALAKLPADRFATAAAFAEALAGRAGATAWGPAVTASKRAPGQRSEFRNPAVIVPSGIALAAIAVAVVLGRRPSPVVVPPIRFVLSASDSTRPFDKFTWPAGVSPDGGVVVYSVALNATHTMLYSLRTDALVAHPISGTEDGYQPYFSPDGKWLAFESNGKERKVRLDGSAPVAITDAGGANGGTWTPGNEIVLGAQGPFHGLSHVSAGGGVAVALTHPDSAKGDHEHLWPIATPDGRSVIFVVWSGSLRLARLAMVSLNGGSITPLGIDGVRPLAILDGRLAYLQADGTVMAAAIDLRRGRITGPPVPVHDPVEVLATLNGNSEIFISQGGAMVIGRAGEAGQLAWVDHAGHIDPIMPEARNYAFVGLSPDERRISAVVADNGKRDLWIYDRAQSTFSPLTTSGNIISAAWAPDGSHIITTAPDSGGVLSVWSQPVEGGAAPQHLFSANVTTAMAALSPDGKSLVVNTSPANFWGISRVALDSGGAARPYLSGQYNDHAPQLSPDGHWAALVSDESGADEVYIRSFPDPGSRMQVSVSGGSVPEWSSDGSRLYYWAGSTLMVARLSFSPTLALQGRDTVIANFPYPPGTTDGYFGGAYKVSRDGTRIVAIVANFNTFQLVVSPNWITEFRRRIAESGEAK